MHLQNITNELIELGKTVNKNYIKKNYYTEKGMIAIDKINKILKALSIEESKVVINKINENKKTFEQEIVKLHTSYLGTEIYNNLKDNYNSCNTIIKRYEIMQKTMGKF